MIDYTIIDIIIAVVAMGSLIVAIKSFNYSKKAFALSFKEHQAKDVNLTTYLEECFKQSEEKESFFAFLLNITNQSLSPDSIIKFELEIHYSDDSFIMQSILVPLCKDESMPNTFDGLSPLTEPINIGGRSSMSGWAFFKISKDLLPKIVEKYVIGGISSTGEKTSVESYLIKEVKSV